MSGKAFVGIDFGTSNSSVAVVRDDPREARAATVKVETIPFRFQADYEEHETPRCPTLVSRNVLDARVQRPLAGWHVGQAIRSLKRTSEPLRHGVDLFRSIKSDLGSGRLYPRSRLKGVLTPQDATRAFFGHILETVKEYLSGRSLHDLDVVLSVPASLASVARDETRAAACAAGLDSKRIAFIDEPVAALVDVLNSGKAADLLGREPRNIAIYDLGGGTLDIAIVRASFDERSATGLSVENLAISPYSRLGGDLIDNMVMGEVIWPQIEEILEISRDDLDPSDRRRLEDTLTPTVARELKEQMCREVSKRFGAGPWTDMAGKIKDVIKPKPAFALPNVTRRLPTNFKMSFAQFDELMSELVSPDDPEESPFQQRMIETIEAAGLSGNDLHAIVLNGGGCKNPWVRRMFDKRSGLSSTCDVVESVHLDTSVARGAAISCYWKNARGIEYVRPIAAESIGIVTRGGRSHQLVKSGTPLPYPDSEGFASCSEFAVPRDGMSTVLIPWCAGREERIVGSVPVELPQGCKAGTLFSIKLRIDRDKRLDWFYQVGSSPPRRVDGIADPWSAKLPTPEERRLNAHRALMRKVLLSTGVLPTKLELVEADLMWECREVDDGRHLDELRIFLRDIDGEQLTSTDRAMIENIAGLTEDWCGRKFSAEQHFRKAVALAPESPVYLGNLGAQLVDLNRLDEAESVMRIALERNRQLPYVHTFLATVYRLRSDEVSARRELEQAEKMLAKSAVDSMTSKELWLQLADVRRALGNYPGAQEAEAQAAKIRLDERFGGDRTDLLAGPDGRPADHMF